MDREELNTLITALTNCESAEDGACPEDCPMKDDEWKREGRAACRALVDDEIIVPAALIRRTVALLKSQEPNEDWISRKRLKDEIQYYIDEAGWGDEANKVLGWCMEFIDNQRAVKWNDGQGEGYQGTGSHCK